MENNDQNATAAKKGLDEIKNFYKGDFMEILTLFFKKPTDGVYSILKNPSKKSFTNSLILFGSIFILYLIGSYFLVGEARESLNVGNFIKIGLFPLICMLIISVLSFGIKTISGKPIFKNELLTGALCGIPFGLLIPILLIVKILVNSNNIMSIMSNPTGAGIVGLLLFFYIILMLISVFQQSLKSSGTKDAIAWYLSPLSVLLAIYLAGQILF